MSALTLKNLLETVTDKSRFGSLEDFFKFSSAFLEFIETGLQARIIAKNENNYVFFQYKKDGQFNISRPINSHLFLPAAAYKSASLKIKGLLKDEDNLLRSPQIFRQNYWKFLTKPSLKNAIQCQNIYELFNKMSLYWKIMYKNRRGASQKDCSLLKIFAKKT